MNERGEHMPALDGLRALAILLVIPHNASVYPGAHGIMWPFAAAANAGWTGVQLFFVLSGFLITRNLLESREAVNYYTAFFGRRVLRIFPLYFVVLLAFVVLLPLAVTLPREILKTYDQQLWLWLFLSNWTQPFHGTVHWFPHFWSLAVEEQFYLVWPVAVFFVTGRRLLPFCLWVALCAMICRSVLLIADVNAETTYMFTVCRMDALALGAAAAAIRWRQDVYQRLQPRLNRIFIGALALLAGVALITRVYDVHSLVTETIGFTLLALAMAAVVLAQSDAAVTGLSGRVRRVLSSGALRSIGRYSYAMYVFHLLIILLFGHRLLPVFEPLGVLQPAAYAVAIAVASYAVAWLSYHAMEKHFLRLKVHFQPRCDVTHVGSAAH